MCLATTEDEDYLIPLICRTWSMISMKPSRFFDHFMITKSESPRIRYTAHTPLPETYPIFWIFNPGLMFGSCFIKAASCRSRKTHADVLRPLHGLLTSRPTDGDGRSLQKLGSRFRVSPQLMIPLQSIYGPTGLVRYTSKECPTLSKISAAVYYPS